FFGKLYMFMEALNESNAGGPARLTMIWLVALGLLNSVVSAFYYVRVLKAMFLRNPAGPPLSPPPTSVAATILIATAVSLGFGLFPAPLISAMRPAAAVMLSSSGALAPEWSHEPGPGIRSTEQDSVPPRAAPENPETPVTPPTPPGPDASKAASVGGGRPGTAKGPR
ncbi:MAG: hypothetical protein LC745_11020, partial [Planctomycetia bacterium]|nr:hypothetical protein [Planctomycetia bacterium]